MRFMSAFYLFALLSVPPISAQVLPASSGACGVSASGLESCEWLSTPPLRNGDVGKNTEASENKRSKVFVTRYLLAPGAPLNQTAEGRDIVIVGLNDGELQNEKKATQGHVNVTSGSVMLMPKEEPYLLRNVGKDALQLLLIEVRK